MTADDWMFDSLFRGWPVRLGKKHKYATIFRPFRTFGHLGALSQPLPAISFPLFHRRSTNQSQRGRERDGNSLKPSEKTFASSINSANKLNGVLALEDN